MSFYYLYLISSEIFPLAILDTHDKEIFKAAKVFLGSCLNVRAPFEGKGF